jgi:hypothetical protein
LDRLHAPLWGAPSKPAPQSPDSSLILYTRKFHESLAATADMAVLPGVLECRPLRRTLQVRLGTITLRLPGGTPILFALAALRSVPQAGSQFRGLVTVIHEISGLARIFHGHHPVYTLKKKGTFIASVISSATPMQPDNTHV